MIGRIIPQTRATRLAAKSACLRDVACNMRASQPRELCDLAIRQPVVRYGVKVVRFACRPSEGGFLHGAYDLVEIERLADNLVQMLLQSCDLRHLRCVGGGHDELDPSRRRARAEVLEQR